MITQTERVYEALKLGPLTSATAFTQLGCVHLPRRILDLKEMGADIETESASGINRYGVSVHYNIYSLKSEIPAFCLRVKKRSAKRSRYLAGFMAAARLVAVAPDLFSAKAALAKDLSKAVKR